jgi:hypothetical protein
MIAPQTSQPCGRGHRGTGPSGILNNAASRPRTQAAELTHAEERGRSAWPKPFTTIFNSCLARPSPRAERWMAPSQKRSGRSPRGG